jgi:uncharacterized membrane protein
MTGTLPVADEFASGSQEIRWGGTAMQISQDIARLQGFSDAVFALSATLLVVTLEVPHSYEALLESVAGFPAFALAFAAIISLWYEHRRFFAEYPLMDDWTVVLNGLLLFVILLYVYPLKLLSLVVAELLLGATPDVTIGMGAAEIQGLYLIFGAAAFAVAAVFTLLHVRAWQRRADLGLDALNRFELRQKGFVLAAIVSIAGLSMFVAALGVGLGWGLPVVVYVLSPIAYVVERSLTASRRRQLQAAASEPHTPAA